MRLKTLLELGAGLFGIKELAQRQEGQLPLIAARATDLDAADLLYRYGGGGLFVSLLASSGLTVIAIGHAPVRLLCTWWTLMVVVLTFRGIDILQFRLFNAPSNLSGQSQICRFGVGLVVTALMWATFPLVFFRDLDQTGRAYTAVIVSAMVGGSASVLAPSQPLFIIYCGCLLLPTSILFLFLGGIDNLLLGVLGCTFFAVMSGSARVTHNATMRAIRLSRANEALAAEARQERQRTETANVELKAAQSELREINHSLEARIEARTADLEREMREKERYAKELAYLASMDSLTGICNRLTMSKHLSKALADAEMSGESLALLFVDLDRFKEVNDVMGHFAGDSVLRTVAQRLSDSVKWPEGLARWGGDEFVVAMPCPANSSIALELANAIRKSLCDPIDVDLGIVTIDATIGIALFPEHGRTADDLVRAADIAMYDGKQRHCKVQLFEPSLSQQLNERHFLEKSLRDAIGTDEFSLVFQPIIGARSGRCEIVEALARWHHPQRGAIPPMQFIPLAERTGEINAMGRWVLLEACREAAGWPGANPPAVSVNISAVQVDSGSLVSDVLEALAKSALPPRRLHLELTESVFAGDHSSINPVLKSLRARGIRILLDDFGTGFSCLSYLRRLPIDMIKIDKSFVADVGVDAGPIVETIVTTAQTFGLKTVAEGVETQLQARSMLGMRADYLQGYLISDVLSRQQIREQIQQNYAVSSI